MNRPPNPPESFVSDLLRRLSHLPRGRGKFQMTEEDLVLISNKLPELVEKGSKRSKQEEKERPQKIKQLKAGIRRT